MFHHMPFGLGHFSPLRMFFNKTFSSKKMFFNKIYYKYLDLDSYRDDGGLVLSWCDDLQKNYFARIALCYKSSLSVFDERYKFPDSS